MDNLTNPFDAIEAEATKAVLRGIGRAYTIMFSPRPVAPALSRDEAEALMFPELPALEDKQPKKRKDQQ